eukprot:353481-Chlamydomonas_euryale.AAC.4
MAAHNEPQQQFGMCRGQLYTYRTVWCRQSVEALGDAAGGKVWRLWTTQQAAKRGGSGRRSKSAKSGSSGWRSRPAKCGGSGWRSRPAKCGGSRRRSRPVGCGLVAAGRDELHPRHRAWLTAAAATCAGRQADCLHGCFHRRLGSQKAAACQALERVGRVGDGAKEDPCATEFRRHGRASEAIVAVAAVAQHALPSPPREAV